ncbi:DUF3152 domain-containing protein [Streptomyces sp. NPDC051976]|uniref:DUF3152 domain-containing protein n=1 Tax=Streptomyces sp. NPDC051976 TaxID=3154947 RepID=UPI0034351614
MGKHSARGGQDGRDNPIPGPVGLPGRGPVGPSSAGAPGSGRRRRGPGTGPGIGPVSDHDADAFLNYRPQDHDGPPPAHPEHREHGAWGASGGWPAAAETGRYYGPARTRGVLDPIEEWAEDWAAYDTAAALSGPTTGPVMGGSGMYGRAAHAPATRLIPRPRQEFVDAFGPDAPPVTTLPAEPLTPSVTEVDETRGKSGGKGRTLSGVAAAAVVTVLAVVATGQLHGSDKKHSDPPSGDPTARSTPDEASRSQNRSAAPTGAPSATVAPASYDELMARQYPLDPHLALSGAFTTVAGHQAAPGTGKLMRFRVDVERGLPLDADLFSETVFKTLNDDRSWGHGGKMTFERVSSGPADIVITLASPATTAKWCAKSGLDTSIENVSCDAASTPRTMINAYRWAQGADTYGAARMHEYRQMLINHEVGHRLGHSHVGCPAQGAPAPVMMQQTKFLSLDGGPTCKPNAWPFP